jgi:hypothetical protein
MKPKTIPVISIMALDFDSIKTLGDREVYLHLVRACRSSRTRIIPAKVRHDRYCVSRGTDRVTLHLHLGEMETCRVSFVPPPDFS